MSDCGDWKRIDLDQTGDCDSWVSINDSAGDCLDWSFPSRNCDSWVNINDSAGDCLDWDSPSRICWILDTGAWKDACFWRDLSLWRDAEMFWSKVA
jgi:hypothetical protein